MKSFTTEKFWKAFEKLPPHIPRKARASYQIWKENPYHSSLQFKQIHPVKPIYSARVGIGWRTVGVKDGDEIVRYWIGSHEEYNNLILTALKHIGIESFG